MGRRHPPLALTPLGVRDKKIELTPDLARRTSAPLRLPGRTMTGAQKFFVLTCFATYVLIIIGGVVRITDSGLGCPDWPLCHGEIIPPAEKTVLIEFSHRTAATIVGSLIVAMGVLVWRQHREPPIRWLMLAVFPLLALQVILGGITVRRELPASIVATHHATAMLLLALLILVTTLSVMSTRGRSPTAWRSDGEGATPYPRWALLATFATLALMVTGSYVAASGASLAFDDWPLFDGRLLPDGGRYENIHWLHRVTAAGVGGIIVAVAEYTRRTQRHSRPLVSLAAIAVAIYAVQVVVGAGNIWSNLNDSIAATHLALGALLWSTLVLLSILALYYATPAVRTSRELETARPELAHGP